MKRIIWILLLVVSVSCTKECNETLGSIVQQEIEVASFDAIIVNTGVEVILKDANSQRVIVETGENRLDNVRVNVVDGVLELEADPSCFLNPSFDAVKVYVDSPNIQIIRNSSEHTVYSNGYLGYYELKLFSNNYENNYNHVGNFNLKVHSTNLYVVSNGMSVIQIEGTANSLELYYYDGLGKFEGKDLIVQNVRLFHRGENSLKINPQLSLKGAIYATGDVISYNQPPVVEVTEHFMGRLLFE